jgi:DNA repair photolyase
MRLHGGLKREDWENWGRWTTFKSNAPELLRRELRPWHVIYCSPLVDPYQPAEESGRLMPRILDALIERPPRVFTLQTRGPLLLRDLDRLRELARRTLLRVSFSITTDDDRIRRLYEPHCSPNSERLDCIARLRSAGITTFATLAPLLPCDPNSLVDVALEASGRDLIGDPLHERSAKPTGATTRAAAVRISAIRGFEQWHDPFWQRQIVERMRARAEARGKRFAIGPQAFAWLAEVA